MSDAASRYELSNNWFEMGARPVWEALIPSIKPARILEIGSFEGASVCYLIDKLGAQQALELHCVDTWEGGMEHAGLNMGAVEQRFDANVAKASAAAAHPVVVHKHKGYSDGQLAKLLVEGKAGYFDFAYVDGSHQAPDVLCDAVLAFRLLRVGGVLVFDDYIWGFGGAACDPLNAPKIAVDAFSTMYARKLAMLNAPCLQKYFQKTAN